MEADGADRENRVRVYRKKADRSDIIAENIVAEDSISEYSSTTLEDSILKNLSISSKYPNIIL